MRLSILLAVAALVAAAAAAAGAPTTPSTAAAVAAAGRRAASSPSPSWRGHGPWPTIGSWAGTEIGSTVSLLYQSDVDVSYTEDGQDFTSRCVEMLNRAVEYKAKTVNFMVTAYWVDANGDGVVDYFCHKVKWGAGCPRASPLAVDRFRFGLQWCLAKAVDLGFDIAITPHLDDGLERGGWRNALVFDPLVAYGGMSYHELLLRPIAAALNAVVAPTTRVMFALQGEMSATVVYHPRSWTALVKRLKADVVAGRDDAADVLPNVLVGVSTNFNKLCACVLMDLVDPTQYLKLLPAALKPLRSTFNKTAINELYDAVDLIGISSYASTPPGFTLPQLEDAIAQFDAELKQFGPDLKTLIHRKGKALVLSEYGVGGGIHQNGTVPAKTAAEAAALPFFGIFGAYGDGSSDPWNTSAPESVDVEVRSWRRHYYKETARWLTRGGGPVYRVDALFLWALASWDVQAIHYASRSYDGSGRSYRDAGVARTVTRHNELVNEARRRRALLQHQHQHQQHHSRRLLEDNY